MNNSYNPLQQYHADLVTRLKITDQQKYCNFNTTYGKNSSS